MTKIATDIEQSKVLAEILPIESADMTYLAITRGGTTIYDWEISIGLNPAITQNLFSYRNGYVVPAWSLNALLDILPSSTLDSSDDHHYRVLCRERFTEWHDNAVDACVEMILKLNKENLL